MVGATRAAETPETSLSITIAIARYTWYLIMERIYSACGVKREDYHKRKFSGRPLKEIMRKSEKIFTEAKQMLRDFKDDSIDGIEAKHGSRNDHGRTE